ncbi:biotin/lipoyl-binding protein [bacterium]|nr:biotin/lipoyl-binding protein [bacterium]
MRARRIAALAGVLVASATGLALACTTNGRTVEVAPGALRSLFIARAAVVAEDGSAAIRARTAGRVVRVLVKEGETVTEGQLLAEIEAQDLAFALARAEADSRSLSASARAIEEGVREEERTALEAEARAAEAEVSLAEDREAREARLHTADVATEQRETEAHHSCEAARARLAAARARLELARKGGRASDVDAARERAQAAAAEVERLKTELQWTKLTAPTSGVLLARRACAGDVVSPAGEPLFEIADVSRTEIKIEAEELDAASLALERCVSFTARGGGPELARGRIVRVGARLERRSIGAEEARVRADALVRPAWARVEGASPFALGQRLEAKVEGPARPVRASLPRSAVHVSGGRTVVKTPFGPWCRETPVELGDTDDRTVEVRGLEVGVRVLVP